MTNNPNLGPQFNDLYEMGHNHTGAVPTHALHDLLSAEYLVQGRDIPDAFEVDRAPHYTPEKMDALTDDVGQRGIQKPLTVTRSINRYTSEIHHELTDGSHRYLAALRNQQDHVPVHMQVNPG